MNHDKHGKGAKGGKGSKPMKYAKGGYVPQRKAMAGQKGGKRSGSSCK